jgi:hypothetical protein
VLVSLGIKQGREQKDCRRMIGRVDRHGDGCVDFGDFKEMMRHAGPRLSYARTFFLCKIKKIVPRDGTCRFGCTLELYAQATFDQRQWL